MTDSDSLESILADMRRKYVEESEKPSNSLVGDSLLDAEKPIDSTLDKLLNELKQDFKTGKTPPQAQPTQSVKIDKNQPLERVNSPIESFSVQKKVQDEKIIQQKAQQWLNELDPLSGEGIWFADFAKHYPSPLAAAIDLFVNRSV